jgi:TonB family protein
MARLRSGPRGLGAVAALAVAMAAGCGGQQDATVFPTDFEPGPPRGKPPAPDLDAPGVDYLIAVAPRFVGPWGAFLDDLRLRLPPGHELNRRTLSVTVRLEIDTQGDLISLRVTAPSGSAAFDEAAEEVAREAMPLPRPPTRLLSDDDRLHLEWQFARDDRQAGPATARIHQVLWPLERALPALLGRKRIDDAALRVAAEAERAGDQPGGRDQAALVASFREVCAAVVTQALASDEGARQAAGVSAAVAAGLGAAAPALRRLASGSTDPGVRRAALVGLGRLGDRPAVPLLRQVALIELGQGSENSGAAAAALFAMGQEADVRAATVGRLRSSSEVGRWNALVVMTQIPVPEAVPDLVKLVGSNGRAPRAERITAAAALGAIAAHGGEGAPEAVAALTECLGAAEAARRTSCAAALGGAGPAGAVAYRKLTSLLRDRDESVRAAATRAAARLDPDRFARSAAALPRERSDLVLAAQAEGLATVPGKRALGRLAKLVNSDSPAVRLAAATALVRRSEPRAIEILGQLQKHRDPAVRAVAIRGEARPDALRAALHDDAAEVRVAALAALTEREGQRRSLRDAAEMIAAAPADGVEKVHIAQAWLGRAGEQHQR